ncbi:MAG: type II toxin-antitoxin system HicA family toxin, partial [Thiobacillaceae bacterium]
GLVTPPAAKGPMPSRATTQYQPTIRNDIDDDITYRLAQLRGLETEAGSGRARVQAEADTSSRLPESRARQRAAIVCVSRTIYHAAMNGKEVIRRLEQAGWRVARVQGSHHIPVKAGVPRSVPVPVHGSRDLSAGLVKAIERQSGVKLA